MLGFPRLFALMCHGEKWVASPPVAYSHTAAELLWSRPLQSPVRYVIRPNTDRTKLRQINRLVASGINVWA